MYMVFSPLFPPSPVGKKYEKAIEWQIQVVNASFLADIIHSELEYRLIGLAEMLLLPTNKQ